MLFFSIFVVTFVVRLHHNTRCFLICSPKVFGRLRAAQGCFSVLQSFR